MSTTLNIECPICQGEGFIWVVEDGYDRVKECECRKELMIERYLHNSGIDYTEYREKSLATFQTDTDEAKRMKELAEQFISDKTKRGIGYFGRSGTGKTHICIAICQELTRRRGWPHRYFSYRREIQRLKAVAYNDAEYSRLLSEWTTCKVLYIDDLLKLATDQRGVIQKQDLQIIYDIINTRDLNKAVTIFSSEYTVSDITKIDEALGSRIYKMTELGMRCEGRNRRIQCKP